MPDLSVLINLLTGYVPAPDPGAAKRYVPSQGNPAESFGRVMDRVNARMSEAGSGGDAFRDAPDNIRKNDRAITDPIRMTESAVSQRKGNEQSLTAPKGPADETPVRAGAMKDASALPPPVSEDVSTRETDQLPVDFREALLAVLRRALPEIPIEKLETLAGTAGLEQLTRLVADLLTMEPEQAADLLAQVSGGKLTRENALVLLKDMASLVAQAQMKLENRSAGNDEISMPVSDAIETGPSSALVEPKLTNNPKPDSLALPLQHDPVESSSEEPKILLGRIPSPEKMPHPSKAENTALKTVGHLVDLLSRSEAGKVVLKVAVETTAPQTPRDIQVPSLLPAVPPAENRPRIAESSESKMLAALADMTPSPVDENANLDGTRLTIDRQAGTDLYRQIAVLGRRSQENVPPVIAYRELPEEIPAEAVPSKTDQDVNKILPKRPEVALSPLGNRASVLDTVVSSRLPSIDSSGLKTPSGQQERSSLKVLEQPLATNNLNPLQAGNPEMETVAVDPMKLGVEAEVATRGTNRSTEPAPMNLDGDLAPAASSSDEVPEMLMTPRVSRANPEPTKWVDAPKNLPLVEPKTVPAATRSMTLVDPGTDPVTGAPSSVRPADPGAVTRLSQESVQNAPNFDAADRREPGTLTWTKHDLSALSPSFTMSPRTANPFLANQAPVVDAAGLVRQIADQVQAQLARTHVVSKISFQLIPESLGRVTIQVAVVDNTVSARILVAAPEVKDALQHHMVELRTSLNQAGMQIDQLQVHVQSGSQQGLAMYYQYQQEGYAADMGRVVMNDIEREQTEQTKDQPVVAWGRMNLVNVLV